MKEYIEINKETFPTPFRKVLTDFMEGWNACLNSVLQHKTADVEPVRHGEWVETGYESLFSKEVRCSNCGKAQLGETHYCPNCGAKMDGGK